MKLLGISGSLRRHSNNTRLLHTVPALLPSGTHWSIGAIDRLPLYSEDIDGDERPAPVEALREQLEAADGLLIASPEYNYSVPGGLKNAIDWLSRPAFQSPLTGKPVAVISASPSSVGGARMQGHLKQVLTGTLSPIYPGMEFALGGAHRHFDDEGILRDETSRQRLEAFLSGFLQWLPRQLNGAD